MARIYWLLVEGDSCEFGSSKYYALCGFGGILSCGITHTAVVPLDLVKCRIQVGSPVIKKMLCFIMQHHLESAKQWQLRKSYNKSIMIITRSCMIRDLPAMCEGEPCSIKLCPNSSLSPCRYKCAACETVTITPEAVTECVVFLYSWRCELWIRKYEILCPVWLWWNIVMWHNAYSCCPSWSCQMPYAGQKRLG